MHHLHTLSIVYNNPLNLSTITHSYATTSYATTCMYFSYTTTQYTFLIKLHISYVSGFYLYFLKKASIALTVSWLSFNSGLKTLNAWVSLLSAGKHLSLCKTSCLASAFSKLKV